MGVNPVNHTNDIVVDKGVVHGEQRSIPPEIPVQLCKGGGGHGDNGCAIFGRVLNETDGALSGEVLRSLLLLRVALAHAHAGADYHIAHPNGGQDFFVSVIHSSLLLPMLGFELNPL